MKIEIEVEIFDDPEYCCQEIPNSGVETMKMKCNEINSSDGSCKKFTTGHAENYLFFTRKRKFEKCPQCKEAYQKAKEKP